MLSAVNFAELELAASPSALREVEGFYESLGLSAGSSPGTAAEFVAGSSRLRFTEAPAAGAPFYHFAFLAPADRFTEAQAWLSEAAPLLTGSDGGATFEFSFWDARAAYVIDPAGNIVEVIAHRGVAESGESGSFDPRELCGLSEVGLVTPHAEATVAALADAGLPLWFGSSDADSLAFCGEKARTAIVTPPGRGWLPTGRPAETHPVWARVLDQRGTAHEIRLSPAGELVVS